MTGVVALGRRAGPFLDHVVHAHHLEPDAVLGDLGALAEALDAVTGSAGAAVVVVPDRLAGRAGRAVATARAALGGAPVLVHVTRLPPLAADVLVTLAVAVEPALGGPAGVAAALPVLEQQLITLTWLPTVARLEDPSPTLWQHARSALPGTSWLVTSWPEPAIRLLDLDDPPPLPRASQQIGIALADLDGDVSWVTPFLSARQPQAVGTEVPPPPDTAAWWGSKRVTQAVLYPRSPEALARGLQQLIDPGTCAWCRRQVASAACPWCLLPRDGSAAAALQAEPADPGLLTALEVGGLPAHDPTDPAPTPQAGAGAADQEAIPR